MLKELIIFLIRWYLGLKKRECFRFNNQKSKTDVYFFSSTSLMKIVFKKDEVDIHKSNVSLNWLLDERCKIHKVPMEEVDELWRSV